MSSHPTQSKTIRAQLLFAMQEGEYAHCDRLPRESVLAEKMGISRTQLRDILASLEREGFIISVTGKGSFVASKNTEFIREEQLRKIEDYLQRVIELSVGCGLTQEDLVQMLSLLYEEK